MHVEGDEDDPEGARIMALSILLGPLAAADSPVAWPPEWPPGEAGPRAPDERRLAKCVAHLEMDEDGYLALIREAHAMARSPEFTELVGLVARALELKDELDAADLRWLLGKNRLQKYGIPTTEEENADAA